MKNNSTEAARPNINGTILGPARSYYSLTTD